MTRPRAGTGQGQQGHVADEMMGWDRGAIKAFQHAHVTFYYSADGDIDKIETGGPIVQVGSQSGIRCQRDSFRALSALVSSSAFTGYFQNPDGVLIKEGQRPK